MTIPTKRGRAILLVVLFLLLAATGQQLFAATRGIAVKARTESGEIREIPLYRQSYALLVGVSDYSAGWPDLESVESELDQVADALAGHDFTVVRELNPGGRRLRRSFEDFINKYGFNPENRLLFFFSGHGYSRDHGRKGYLVPADAPDPRLDEPGFLRKAVEMGQVLQWARRIETKHALFLFDSCFAGTVFKAKALPDLPPHITSMVARPVRQFITAGSAGEEVPARSVFVPSFLRALRGEGDVDRDGYISGTELGMYLHRKVLSYQTHQTPQYGKIRDPDLDQGDFILVAGGSLVTDRQALEMATKHTGSLRVKTTAGGARIRLDGVALGREPVERTDLAPGVVTVKASKAGYRDREEKVRIRKGRLTEVTLLLDKIPTRGSLQVDSEPGGAKWYLDEAYVGTTPDILEDVKAGDHKVRMRKSGYRDWSEKVEIEAGRQSRLMARLEEEQGPVAASKPQVVASGSKQSWTEPETGMEFVWVEGGCYEMGQTVVEKEQLINEAGREKYDKYFKDELPRHEVCVDSFWLGKYEVTVGQWRKFITASGYRTDAETNADEKEGCRVLLDGKWDWRAGTDWQNPGFSQEDTFPVACVSYRDVQAFQKWLREKSGREYRLPTEAEWEYAARGGSRTVRFWGDEVDSEACRYASVADREHGWQNSFPCDDGYKYTAPVGSFLANDFGLYDMLGNVWEWCQDRYGKDYYGQSPRTNPQGPSSGSSRVARGGSWFGSPRSVRAADRLGGWPSLRSGNLGFRLALPPGQ